MSACEGSRIMFSVRNRRPCSSARRLTFSTLKRRAPLRSVFSCPYTITGVPGTSSPPSPAIWRSNTAKSVEPLKSSIFTIVMLPPARVVRSFTSMIIPAIASDCMGCVISFFSAMEQSAPYSTSTRNGSSGCAERYMPTSSRSRFRRARSLHSGAWGNGGRLASTRLSSSKPKSEADCVVRAFWYWPP